MKKKTLITLTVLCVQGLSLFAVNPETFRQVSADQSTETNVIAGEEGWLYLPSELEHIGAGKFWGPEAAGVSKARKPENADPLPAILDFKDQLDSMGIDLILVPVPAKAMVYPEPLMGEVIAEDPPERLDPYHQEFYAELERNGVTVIDLLPDFLEERSQADVYCRTDTHWSGRGVVLAAAKIAGVLKARGVSGGTPAEATAVEKTIEIKGDLARMQNAGSPVGETLTLRFVQEGSGEPLQADPSSPVLLLGDSHTLVFHSGGDMLASGAGLADQLAYDLGYPVDVIGVRGSGATPARINLLRKSRRDDSYLKGKEAIVWCFSVREFTESSGWSLVPVVQ